MAQRPRDRQVAAVTTASLGTRARSRGTDSMLRCHLPDVLRPPTIGIVGYGASGPLNEPPLNGGCDFSYLGLIGQRS